MLKEQTETPEDSLELQRAGKDDEIGGDRDNGESEWDDGDRDGDVKDAEIMFGILNTLHKMMLDRKPHIKEYKKIRKLHGEICDNMMNYYYDGKFEQKVDAGYVCQNESEKEKRGGLLLIESNFDIETSVGANALQDIVTYKPSPNMNCITEEYIKRNRFRKPEKVEFLHSMLDSELGLFEMTGIEMNEGYAYLKEVFTGREYKITDIGLSGNMLYDKHYVYTRIITYHGVSFGTGLNFIFDKKDPFIKGFIKRNKKDYNPLGELLRFTELYNRYSSDPNGIKVTTNTFD